MQITDFSISIDRTQINVVITDAATLSSLKFWDNTTYKDFSKSIDLTSKLTASSTEAITITLSDLGLTYFDGVYFLEAEDVDEVSNSITSDLTKYKECVLNKLLEFTVCDDCLQTESISLLNTHALITGLQDAIDAGFIEELLVIVKALDKFCSDDCVSCGNKNNVTDSNYYSSND
jgi:hypothetical protein